MTFQVGRPAAPPVTRNHFLYDNLPDCAHSRLNYLPSLLAFMNSKSCNKKRMDLEEGGAVEKVASDMHENH